MMKRIKTALLLSHMEAKCKAEGLAEEHALYKIGCPYTLMTKMRNAGRVPSTINYLRICRWLGANPFTYVSDLTEEEEAKNAHMIDSIWNTIISKKGNDNVN